MQIVAYNADGSGYARIKVPAMNKVEINVTLEGIKVVKGGCVVAGKASFTGANLEATFKQKLDSMYAVYNAALDIVAASANGIAKTYNNFKDLMEGVQGKAAAMAAKITGGGKPSKVEVEELKQLTVLATTQMQSTLDAMKKSFGDQMNQVPAVEIQKIINQNKVVV